MTQVVKTVPIDLKPDATYGIRLRSINAFGASSDWSEFLIVDTSAAGLASAGRLVIGPDGMTGYDNLGQMTFNYLANAVVRTNLVTNPSFESAAVGTTGWTAESNTTISRITSDYFVGQPGLLACMKVQASADGQFIGARTTISDPTRRISVTPGVSYTASVYIRVPVGQPPADLRISFAFYTSGGVLISQNNTTSSAMVQSSTGWARITKVGVTAPSGSSFMSAIIRSESNMSSGSFFYVDGMIVEATGVLRDYFDGSTSAGTSTWSGTTNDSVSTLDNNSIYTMNGGIFTSPTVQTSRTASTTGGVVMNSTGLFGYNTSGVQTFKLSATDAKLTVNTVDVGKDVGSTAGYDGIALTNADMNNIFARRRSDNVVFFRVNNGGANSITYDSSSGILNISGAIAGGTIDIGGFDSTSFHVDSSGNMWLGASSYASSPFKVSSTGTLYSGTSTDNVQVYSSVVEIASSNPFSSINAKLLFTLSNTDYTGVIQSNAGLSVVSPRNGIYMSTDGSYDISMRSTYGVFASLSSFGNTFWTGITSYGDITVYNAAGVGTETIKFGNYAGGWYMSDTSYIRSVNDKHVYTGGGWYTNAAGSGISVGGNGAFGNGINGALVNAYASNFGALYGRSTNAGNSIWTYMQLVLDETGTGQVGMAAYCNSHSWAPMWRVNPGNGVGERWDAINNSNSAYIPIAASAFTVISTERSKKNISTLTDDYLLMRVSAVKGYSWIPKVKPTQLELDSKYVRVNAAWMAKGKPELNAQNWRNSIEHDCTSHDCDGDNQVPCIMMKNFNTGNLGLVAESHYEAFPEHVNLDVEGIPHSIDTSQVAATALATTGALSRKITMLENTIQELESKLRK